MAESEVFERVGVGWIDVNDFVELDDTGGAEQCEFPDLKAEFGGQEGEFVEGGRGCWCGI